VDVTYDQKNELTGKTIVKHEFSSRIPVLKFKSPTTDNYKDGKDCGGKKYSYLLSIHPDEKSSNRFHVLLKDCDLEPTWYQRFAREVFKEGIEYVAAEVPGYSVTTKYLCDVKKVGLIQNCRLSDFVPLLKKSHVMAMVFTEGKAEPVAVSLEADPNSKGRWFGKSISYNDIPTTGTGDKLIVVYHWGKMATAMNIP